MKGYVVFNVEKIEGLPDHYYATPPALTTEERDARWMRSLQRPMPMRQSCPQQAIRDS